MPIGRLLCLFNRHRPNRALVRWNGFHYLSHCRHCDQPIRRKTRGGWRALADQIEGSASSAD